MRWKYLNRTIRKYSKNVNGFHVGIVGSGPAGFYCAQQLLKVIKSVFNQYLKDL
jgi:NADPH-dependent glutamate synthase beta subunit-like oxidoreductase